MFYMMVGVGTSVSLILAMMLSALLSFMNRLRVLTLLVMQQFEVPPARGTLQAGRLRESECFVLAISCSKWLRVCVLLWCSVIMLLLVSIMCKVSMRGCIGLQLQSCVLEVP